jgi:hypothetical protein
MLRYILFVIFGIILFLIFNHKNNFSIGVPGLRAGFYSLRSYTPTGRHGVAGPTRYTLATCIDSDRDRVGGGAMAGREIKYGYLNQDDLNAIALLANFDENDPEINSETLPQILAYFNDFPVHAESDFGETVSTSTAVQTYCKMTSQIKSQFPNINNKFLLPIMRKLLNVLRKQSIDIVQSIQKLRVLGGILSVLDNDDCAAVLKGQIEFTDGNPIDISTFESHTVLYLLSLLRYILYNQSYTCFSDIGGGGNDDEGGGDGYGSGAQCEDDVGTMQPPPHIGGNLTPTTDLEFHIQNFVYEFYIELYYHLAVAFNKLKFGEIIRRVGWGILQGINTNWQRMLNIEINAQYAMGNIILGDSSRNPSLRPVFINRNNAIYYLWLEKHRTQIIDGWEYIKRFIRLFLLCLCIPDTFTRANMNDYIRHLNTTPHEFSDGDHPVLPVAPTGAPGETGPDIFLEMIESNLDNIMRNQCTWNFIPFDVNDAGGDIWEPTDGAGSPVGQYLRTSPGGGWRTIPAAVWRGSIRASASELYTEGQINGFLTNARRALRELKTHGPGGNELPTYLRHYLGGTYPPASVAAARVDDRARPLRIGTSVEQSSEFELSETISRRILFYLFGQHLGSGSTPSNWFNTIIFYHGSREHTSEETHSSLFFNFHSRFSLWSTNQQDQTIVTATRPDPAAPADSPGNIPDSSRITDFLLLISYFMCDGPDLEPDPRDGGDAGDAGDAGD